MDESFAGLVKSWRDCYDDMREDTAEVSEQINTLTEVLKEIAAPYQQRLDEIEKEIKARALMWGEGYKGHGVVVGYRKGYERVSYDAGVADAVLSILQDVLPKTGEALEGARKVSFVSPSVTVKAEEG